MKYVIFELPGHPVSTVRIFDEITNHSDVVREVQAMSPGLKAVSAGKFSVGFDCTIACVNGSVTLKMSFNENQSKIDTDLVTRMFNFQI